MMRRARQIKNHAAEAAQFRRRALVGFLVALAGLGGLAGWYFRLQVLRPRRVRDPFRGQPHQAACRSRPRAA